MIELPNNRMSMIDDARTFFLRSPPPHLLLDVENAGEQLLGRFLRIQLNRAIQEPGLRGEFHRLGFIERRNRDHLAESTQAIDRRTQIRRAVTDVGAKRKINRFTHSINSQKMSGPRYQD